MGLFSSLYTGATGMMAQAQSTSAVSTNIANANTTGYKKTDITFKELVLNERAPSSTQAAGSVLTDKNLRVDRQGNIINTSSSTDIAVVGNGLIPVKTNADTNAPLLYTRNGAFSDDSEGLLRNSAGFVLHGWQFNDQGELPSNLNDTNILVPIDLDLFDTQPLPTTNIEISMNVSADETAIDTHGLAVPSELPASAEPAHFARTFTVFDGQGAARDMTFEFRRIVGPMAHFTSGLPISFANTTSLVGPTSITPGIAAGDILQLTDGTNTLDVTFANAPADITLNEANTMDDVLNVINNFTPGGTAPFDAELTTNGNLLVRSTSPTANLDISGSTPAVIGGTGLNIVPDPGDGDFVYEPEASLTANGAANPNQTDFPAFADTATPNPRFWWELRVTTADPANPATGPQVEISKGHLNFNGDGTLNVQLDANGEANINLGSVNFDNTDTSEDTAITVDITRFSQFSGPFTVINSDQNGAGIGSRSSVEIDADGLVLGNFTNGEQRALYKIPLVMFNNENGLNDLSGTVFEETQFSGTPTLAEAGTGGGGLFNPASIENANVDIASEFGTLIVSQRGFTANSQVFQAVDEMTQTLARIKG